MNPGGPRARLDELIAASGVPLASLTPHAGLELMMRLYGADPADGHLSCSWGRVTRYGEEEFGFHIIRWYEPQPDESQVNPPPCHLALVFKIGPPAVAGDFLGWGESCTNPENLTAFRSTVEESPPFKIWGRSPAAGVALVCEDILSWASAVFDCWGVRDPRRPVVSMTEEQWLRSDDVPLMLTWIRQEWRGKEADLDRILQRYCLACCRRIWRLLPQEASHAGIEVAERFVDGLATRAELGQAEWLAEGAAFKIDNDSEPESIALWCDQVSRIPPEELDAMIHSPRPEDDLSPRGLLKHAAYFADISMCSGGSIEGFRLFLPAPLLREVVGNPFRSTSDRPPA